MLKMKIKFKVLEFLTLGGEFLTICLKIGDTFRTICLFLPHTICDQAIKGKVRNANTQT
jgi:hypothetical protein